MSNFNEFTGEAEHDWAAPAKTRTEQEQLGHHLEQYWRNNYPLLAGHEALAETAERLATQGKLDLTKGQQGIADFCKAVSDELHTPEANGQGGMFAELYDVQQKMGLY